MNEDPPHPATDTRAESPLKWPDMTATERHISRSLRIRRQIMKFMVQNVGQAYEEPSDLANQAANAAGCASETAARWIKQFTAPGALFSLIEQPVGIVLWRNPGREQA